MTHREIREFRRLLTRSEAINDEENLKINLAVIHSQFSELQNRHILSSNDEKELSRRVRAIQSKIVPKRVVSEKTRESKGVKHQAERGVEAELKRHAELTSDLVVLTEKLKETVNETSHVAAADAEVLDAVKDHIASVGEGASKTKKNMDVVKSSRLGWEVYYWFAIVVGVFIVVNFIFF
jgi:uncharacterized phage infection (PIP) family protein YhgE